MPLSARLSKLGQILQAGSLILLLFLLPFSKAAVEISFGLLLLGWLLEHLDAASRRQTLWRTQALRPILLAMAGYLIVCAASIFVSRHPQASLEGLVNKWLEYLLFTILVADASRKPQIRTWALIALSCSAALVAIEAISQEFLGKGLIRGYPLEMYARMTGPYENPIDLATYLMVIIPILVAWTLTQRSYLRWPLALLLVVLIGCLGRTEASGAWLGLLIGLGAVMLLDSRLRKAGLCVFAAMAIAASAWLSFTGRLQQTFSPTELGTRDRWAMWQAAAGMIADRPILGHGLNTFMANYLDYWVSGERQPRYAHNCYLQVAAECGFLGLSFFLALLGSLFWRLRERLQAMEPNARLIGLGLFAGLLAFVIQAAIDTNFYALRQAALFWTVAGLAIGLSETAGATHPSAPSRYAYSTPPSR